MKVTLTRIKKYAISVKTKSEWSACEMKVTLTRIKKKKIKYSVENSDWFNAFNESFGCLR
ncbi:hypothetical protein HYC85_030184 [Camellia sinensis]|uniref:Uncharacterized protein n=1 Tax=Camellia sinensis TaxID=4442 RepID=A0A7J7G003_CAMSI|nr:hypothetical protein HYC85_030184 [Camellia sinensis]